MALQSLKVYSEEEIKKLTRLRSGETKLGQVVETVGKDWKKELKRSKAKFVILGIPEDIGVRANYGRGGAHTAFKPALESFLNQQENVFLTGSDVLVLGEIEVSDVMKIAENLNLKNKEELSELRKLVGIIDERVTEVIQVIIAAKKIPVIVGGGHNNAYGNIKGASKALNKKISVINCDPHLDFRPLEGRHSGNGFSYAFEENYLNSYAVLALHEQYNGAATLGKFLKHPKNLFYNSYESVFVREELTFQKAMKQCLGFVQKDVCGVEIDLDAITNVPSSAKTSSGISPVEARQYAYCCGQNLNALYFHIAEGAPVLSHIKADNKTGKLIAYLISDFIKGVKDSAGDV